MQQIHELNRMKGRLGRLTIPARVVSLPPMHSVAVRASTHGYQYYYAFRTTERRSRHRRI